MVSKISVGCLLLHGLTSSLDTIRGNIPWLEKENIPYAMPILRGHSGQPEDLVGLNWSDWYTDAEGALDELNQRCVKVIVIGVSMGSLLALELGLCKPAIIAAQVLVAPALRFRSYFFFLLPLLKGFVKFWPVPLPYNDPQCAAANTNYKRCPTESLVSLLHCAQHIEKRLDQVTVPTLILHSKKDGFVSPDSALIIQNSIAAQEKKTIWFEKSGHEMLQDLEADLVIATIREYVLNKVAAIGA
ncbi:alpha/beta fold hydrolase [bacterium]|nr:alpha/beta fold hydrolase [bacterium]